MDEPTRTPAEPENISDDSSGIPEEAFLVLEGIKVVPLTQAVINIGRRFENQIVIDDTRVSRNHAQLHAVDGHYELIDLNSSGGTYINGMSITKSILYPGDEISLAGFTMLYGQHDSPPRTDLRETSPLRPD